MAEIIPESASESSDPDRKIPNPYCGELFMEIQESPMDGIFPGPLKGTWKNPKWPRAYRRFSDT